MLVKNMGADEVKKEASVQKGEKEGKDRPLGKARGEQEKEEA